MKAQAVAGIEAEKTAARAEGFEAGYTEAQEEVLALRVEVSKLLQWLEDTVSKFGGLFAKMRGVLRDVRIDLNNRDIAKSALEESPGFEAEFDKIRKALKRVGATVQSGGIAGRMAREQDSRTLAPFRAEEARRERMGQSTPPADDADPDADMRPDL